MSIGSGAQSAACRTGTAGTLPSLVGRRSGRPWSVATPAVAAKCSASFPGWPAMAPGASAGPLRCLPAAAAGQPMASS
eukprot:15283325-Alexandrium_andersonii.AAC.1